MTGKILIIQCQGPLDNFKGFTQQLLLLSFVICHFGFLIQRSGQAPQDLVIVRVSMLFHERQELIVFVVIVQVVCLRYDLLDFGCST